MNWPAFALVLLVSVGVCTIPSRLSSASSSDTTQSALRDLRVGERYSGGVRVRSPFVGVTFVVPKDWHALLPAGSVMFLDSSLTAGLGTAHLLTDVTRETVRAHLSEPQQSKRASSYIRLGPSKKQVLDISDISPRETVASPLPF